MIILDATNETLELVLQSAVSTNELQYTVNYVDVTTTTYTPGNTDGLSTGTTTVTIASAPSASTQRQIKLITVYNNDTASARVIIKKDTAGTEKILCKILLNVGDSLIYSDGKGFNIITTDGGFKNSDAQGYLGFAAGASTINSGTVIFSNSNNINFGLNGSTITASANNYQASFYEVGFAEYNANAAATNSAAINLSMQRFFIPYNIVATRLDLLAHLTVAGSTNGTWSISAGVFTRNANSINSASTTFSGVNFGSGGATTNTNSYSGISGTRVRSISLNSWSFTPGEYWFGFINSVQGPAGTTGSVTIYGQSSVSVLGIPGGNNDSLGLKGIYSNATGAFPSTMNITDIYFAHTQSGSIIMRQPAFRLYGTH